MIIMFRYILILFGIAIVALQVFFEVQQWQQCIILEFGKPIKVIKEPGLYFKIPLIQDLIVMEKRILGSEARPTECMTSDKKRLILDTVSRWRIDAPLLLFQTVQNYSGATTRLNDVTLALLKQEISKYSFKAVIGQGLEDIMKRVTEGADEQCRHFGMKVIDVRIKRVDLPEEVQDSVFSRMKADREQIAKKYRAEGDQRANEIRGNADKKRETILAQAYRQSQSLRGEGEAESAKIYSAAYKKDEDFFTFMRSMEAYKKIFAKDTFFFLRVDSPLLRFFESSAGTKSSRESTQASGPQKR